MTERRLIVNADDFGLTPGVDRGILRAVAAGSVSSVSIMANLAEGVAVAALAAAYPEVSLGAHLNLTTGRPLRPGRELPSLVDATGEFLSLATLTRRALAGRVRGAEVARELEAQLARLRGHGAAVDHVDSHEHVHLLPGVTGAVIAVARRARVARLRCHRPRLFAARGRRRGEVLAYYAAHPRRVVSHALKRVLAARFRRAGLGGPDGVVSPALLLDPPPPGPLAEWDAVLAALPPGTWELVVHPADLTGPGDTAPLGDLVERRGVELAALESAAFPRMLRERGVTLVNYVERPLVPDTEERHARRA